MRTTSSHDVAPQVVSLFLLTSLLLILAESRLSASATMTVAALKLYLIVLLLIGSAGLIWRRTGSVELSVLFFPAYLAIVLWLRSGWLVLLLVAASIVFLRSVDVRRTIRALLAPEMLIASGIAAALLLSVTHYADFLVMEKLLEGDVHQDTLYHASIASMIKTYGAVSTGLHGLMPLHYHVLSHRLFGALSILSGVHVLEVYGIAHIVFLCPLLIGAATWCACRLSNSDAPGAVRHWLVTCGVLIMLTLLPLEKLGVWDSYFVSESYTLSLVYLLIALPLLVSSGSMAEIAIAGALIVLAGLSKGSVGVIGLGLLWARAVALPASIARRTLMMVAVLVTIVFFSLMFAAAQTAAARSPFNPFYYAQLHSKVYGTELRESVRDLMSGQLPRLDVLTKSLMAIVLYLLANFLLSWIVVLWRLSGAGLRAVVGHPDSLFNIVAVAIALATLMFEITGGWYFINPAMFVALPFLAAVLSRRFEHAPAVASWVAMIAVALGAASLVSGSYRDKVGIYLKTRNRLTGRSYESNIGTLLSLRDKETARAVVFLRNEGFPGRGALWSCTQEPFVYPALTERAWIGLIDVNSDCPYANYGYESYFTGQPRVLKAPVIPPNVPIVPVSAPKREPAMGEWTTPAFSASDFTAFGSMTWTVQPGDVATYAYTLVGKTMIVAFDIGPTSVGGSPGVALQLAIPGGFVSAKAMFATIRCRDNGVDSIGSTQTLAHGTIIYLYKNAHGDNWSASQRNTRVVGSITFEIQ